MYGSEFELNFPNIEDALKVLLFVFDDHESYSLFIEIPHFLADFRGVCFVHAGERLVKEEEFLGMHEGISEGEELAFAAAHVEGGAFAQRGEGGELGEDVFHALAGVGGGIDAGGGEEVFLGGEILEDVFLLGHVGDAPAEHFGGGAGGDVFADKGDFGFGVPGGEEAVDGFQDGAFAGAVAAGEEDDFARVHVKGDVGEDLFFAVAGGDVADAEEAGGGAHAASLRVWGGVRRGVYSSHSPCRETREISTEEISTLGSFEFMDVGGCLRKGLGIGATCNLRHAPQGVTRNCPMHGHLKLLRKSAPSTGTL